MSANDRFNMGGQKDLSLMTRQGQKIPESEQIRRRGLVCGVDADQRSGQTWGRDGACSAGPMGELTIPQQGRSMVTFIMFPTSFYTK